MVAQTPKRLVIKLGSSLFTDKNGCLATEHLEDIVAQLAWLRRDGAEIILVSSGAIALGMAATKVCRRPTALPELQACAAIGQHKLMHLYSSLFAKHGFGIAQILLTRDDMHERSRYLNAKHTLLALLKQGVIPIVNENDSVAVEEIKFGDNDMLSALVANLIGADMLIILSDVKGLYADARHADDEHLIRKISAITPEIKKLAGSTRRLTSVGGMNSKLAAAEIAASSGTTVALASGHVAGILKAVITGQALCTYIYPRQKHLKGGKDWLAYAAKTKGTLFVDDGAHQALTSGHKSLLASGVTRISGSFAAGDTVSVASLRHNIFAKGRVNYSSEVLGRIKGLKSSEITDLCKSNRIISKGEIHPITFAKVSKKALDGKKAAEVIHCDNMVIL